MLRNRFANRFASVLAVMVAATLSSSCGDGGDPLGSEIDEVSIVALNRTVSVRGTVQAEGRAFTRDDEPVPGLIAWSVSNPAIISVTGEIVTTGSTVVNRATVTGVAAGKANLIATAGAKTASVEIVVSAGAPGYRGIP